MNLSELASRLKNAVNAANQAHTNLSTAQNELQLAGAMVSRDSVIDEIQQVSAEFESAMDSLDIALQAAGSLLEKKVQRLEKKRNEPAKVKAVSPVSVPVKTPSPYDVGGRFA